MSALPNRNRLPRNIRAGYEIEMYPGEWVRVISSLKISAPLNLVRFEMANGHHFATFPDARFMSRRLAEVAA